MRKGKFVKKSAMSVISGNKSQRGFWYSGGLGAGHWITLGVNSTGGIHSGCKP